MSDRGLNAYRIGWSSGRGRLGRSLLVAVQALVCALVCAGSAAAAPAITSAPVTLKAGSKAEIDVIARSTKVCELRLAGPHHLGGRYSERVLHGVFVRFRWIAGRSAAPGVWKATVRCGRSKQHADSAGLVETPITVKGQKRARGPLVKRGSMHITSAALPPARTVSGHVTGLAGEEAGIGSAGCVADAGGYCLGYCTHFVWTKRLDLSHLGNASAWLSGARARGVPTGNSPAVGAAAWWSASSPYVRGSAGHIAYVVGVGNGTVTFQEMNGPAGWNVVDTQTMSLSSRYAPQGYIYGGPAGGPGTTPGPTPAPPPPATGPNLYRVQFGGSTGSGLAEMHALSGPSNFLNYLVHDVTGDPLQASGPQYGFADANGDGKTDLYRVQYTGGTSSGQTEVHILNGAGEYQSYLAHLVTADPLQASGRAQYLLGDYNGDGRPDLYRVQYVGTGSGKLEIHVLDGVTAFTTYLAHWTSADPLQSPGQAQYLLGDYNRDGRLDLYRVQLGSSGSGRVEVHVLNGADGFQTYLAQLVTGDVLQPAGQAQYSLADGNHDGSLDLYRIQFNGPTGSGRVEVHALDGANGFQTFLGHWATPDAEQPDGVAYYTVF